MLSRLLLSFTGAGGSGAGCGKGSSGAQGTKTCTGDPNAQPFDASRMVRVRCSNGASCVHKLGAVQAKWRYQADGTERTKGFVCSPCGKAAHKI